jgi:TonB family protein
VARIRPYRRGWVLLPALALSATAQGTAFLTYAATRPAPVPLLTVRIEGAGEGQVLVTRAGETAPALRCATAHCYLEIPAGSEVHLVAVPGDGATFAGWAPYPIRPPEALVPYLGDPLADCIAGDAVTAALRGDVRDCPIRLTADTEVVATFGLQPKEVDVALVDQPAAMPDVKKPDVPRPPPPPIDPEKLQDKPLEVAIVPPPPVPKLPPPLPPPPPPPPPPPATKPPPPPPPNMTMVEVADKNVVDKAPDDATHLSDKNRDVAEETRAKQTNLDKASEGTAVASRESDDHTSKEVGGPDDRIRQLEQTDKTTDDRVKPSDHSGDKATATGAIKGAGGDSGDNGTGAEQPGLLSMRGIGGRGRLADQKAGDGKKAGKQGLPGINTPLAFNDYERIMGKERVDEERELAARKMSSKKGRWERKLDAIRSSLENFVPDVRPGNQDALKTRAHPFALFIARMHRRIHELWGFGFLEALDNRGADDPLNNPDLFVNIEVAVNPDGSVFKTTIAKTSGQLEFDVAAVDTVQTGAPYDPPPDAIKSVDGRVYLRWGFYRNWRQCGTFNVEPYILTDIPGGAQPLDDGAMVKGVPKLKKRPPSTDKPVTPDDGKGREPVSPTSSVTDKQALFAANLWVSGFAQANVDKLVKLSTVPFYAGGQVAAQTAGDLKDMYGNLLVELGPLKDWKLLTAAEYAAKAGGPVKLAPDQLVLVVQTTKESFAVVMSRTKSGDYRATQLAR